MEQVYGEDRMTNELDEETMLCWFANAIMAGYDFAKKRYEK